MIIQILIGLGFVVAIYIVATLEVREHERFKFKQYMTTVVTAKAVTTLTNFHFPMGDYFSIGRSSPLYLFNLMEITYYENFNNFKRSF